MMHEPFPAASFAPGPTLEHLMVMPVASRRVPVTIMWQKAVAAAGHSAAPLGPPPPAPALGPDAHEMGNRRRSGKLSVRHSPVAARSPPYPRPCSKLSALGAPAAGEERPARGADGGGRQDPRHHRVPA